MFLTSIPHVLALIDEKLAIWETIGIFSFSLKYNVSSNTNFRLNFTQFLLQIVSFLVLSFSETFIIEFIVSPENRQAEYFRTLSRSRLHSLSRVFPFVVSRSGKYLSCFLHAPSPSFSSDVTQHWNS